MPTGVPGRRGSVVDPTLDDPLVGSLSEVVGGRVGRYRAAPDVVAWQRRALGGASLLATVAILGALALGEHCRQTLWKAPYQFTHLCYSDIPALFSTGGLGEGITPYLEPAGGGYLAQPVGTGALLWLLALVSPGGPNELRWVFDLATIGLLISLIATAAAVGLLAGRRAWDAALVAASPVVVVSSLISLDLVAIAAGTVGLLAFARRRTVLGGVLVGLGVAVRPIEIVLVLAVLIVAIRRDRLGGAGAFVVAAGLGWALLNVPVALLSAHGWATYWRSVWQADLSYGSLLLIPQLLHTELQGQTLPEPPLWLGAIGILTVFSYGLVLVFAGEHRREWMPGPPWVVAVLGVVVSATPFAAVAAVGAGPLGGVQALPAGTGRWVALVGYCLVTAGVVWLAHRAPVPPRVPAVALLLAIGWLLVSPATPVQAGLWLLPLIALTLPSWWVMVAFGAAEAAYGAMTWLYLYGLQVDNRGAPVWLYLLFLFLRVAAWLWIAWRAWSLCWWPYEDVIRRDVGDDPSAGPLASGGATARAARPGSSTFAEPVDLPLVPTGDDT